MEWYLTGETEVLREKAFAVSLSTKNGTWSVLWKGPTCKTDHKLHEILTPVNKIYSYWRLNVAEKNNWSEHRNVVNTLYSHCSTSFFSSLGFEMYSLP